MKEPKNIFLFEIDREKVSRYFFWLDMISLSIISLITCGFGIILFIAYYFFFKEFPIHRAHAIEYRIEGINLYMKYGYFCKIQKMIPLNKSTEIILHQNPLMQKLDVSSIIIRNFGGLYYPFFNNLVGIKNPQDTYQRLIEYHDQNEK